MWNNKTILNSHDAKILFPKKCTAERTCNCLNKDTCPLDQKSLNTNIISKVKVKSSNRSYKEKSISNSVKPPLKNDLQITRSHLI